MAYTDIQFTGSKVIVTYDLNNNNVSAQEIANASNGNFSTTISMKNGNKYKLPNTTLASTISSVNEAVTSFKNAFEAAKYNKGISYCSISRIFACEVFMKDGYIENN